MSRFLRHTTALRFGVGFCSILLTLLILEIGLRIFAPRYGAYTQPDDNIGYSLIPGAHYTFVAPDGCPGWESSGTLNSHGLRDREIEYGKPPGTFRILALGDSYTEAFALDLSLSWPKQLERQLSVRGGGQTYEVINMGRSAMGTGTEYLEYLDEGRKYDPDLVILLFIPNDFTDNSRVLSNSLQPYFYLSDGRLELDTSFKKTRAYLFQKLIQPFKRNFHLVRFVAEAYYQISARLLARGKEAGGPFSGQTVLTAEEQGAVELTERILLELARAVQRDGGRFVLVIGTSPAEVNWKPSEGAAGDAHALLTSQASHIMATFAEREGLAYLDLGPELAAYSREHQTWIHGCDENGGAGHWSQAGQTVAAEAIDRFLLDKGLVSDSATRSP